MLYWLSGLTCNEQNFITKSGCSVTRLNTTLLSLRRTPVRRQSCRRCRPLRYSARCRVLPERNASAVE
ncbi:hypothetical protein ACVXHA_20470 [Escherichia coli]